MAKKQKTNLSTTEPGISTAATEQRPAANTPTVDKPKLSIYDFKVQAWIVALLAFIFYANTYFNEHAHDDGIVIIKNEYVQEGFAGLKGIFTKDAYDSYYRQLNTVNQLAGGRYRPLSIATFAIEQQFFGATPEDKVDSLLKQNFTYGISGPEERKLVSNMHMRHLFTIFWYMGLVVVLLYFLRAIVLKDNPMIAFLATILFTIHPIHTEVVANVKSRDEIMSLLFICLTFIFAFKYEAEKKLLFLGAAMLSLFLAFLSKEYAITLGLLLPLAFYLFRDYSIPKSIRAFLPYLAVVAIYLFIRIKVAIGDSDQTLPEFFANMRHGNENSDKEILNNPYYFATHTQKIATEIATSLNYLKLLIFPHPLSADYSYNSIPYKDFSNWQVGLSLLVHSATIGATVFFTFVRKEFKVLAFAGAFYILHLLLVNNMVFNIGATMGERLIFHSSVGFSIAVAMLIYWICEKIQPAATSKTALIGIMSVITILCAVKTISRNPDWETDQTLFFQDINVVPNSVLVNGNVAAAYISMSDKEKDENTKNAYLHKAIGLLDKAIAIHPTFVAGYLNQGIAYYKLGVLDSAQKCLDSVRKNYPSYPTLKSLYTLLGDYHMRNGWNNYGKFGRYPEAIKEFEIGISIDSTNPELYYNLGGAYYSNHQPAEAIEAWSHTLKLNPNHTQAQQGMNAAYNILHANQAPKSPDPNGKKNPGIELAH